MSIRFATVEDVEEMLGVYEPYVEHTTASFEYTAPDPDGFRRRFLAITAQFPWLVWEEAGRILGYAYASAPFERAAYRWCAEPSIYLAPEAQRRGIGRRLYGALEALLRRQGYGVLYAIITSENAASLAFHRSVGYVHLADFPGCAYKFGKTLGITWMEKRLDFVEYPTNFPRTIGEIVESDKNLPELLDKFSLSPKGKM